VVEQASSPRVVHLATHGFFLPDQQIKTDRMGLGEAQPSGLEDPMLRSELYFAGADRTLAGKPTAEGPDNGVLTAMEAGSLDLIRPRTLLYETQDERNVCDEPTVRAHQCTKEEHRDEMSHLRTLLLHSDHTIAHDGHISGAMLFLVVPNRDRWSQVRHGWRTLGT
jgi:hypothetical protein